MTDRIDPLLDVASEPGDASVGHDLPGSDRPEWLLPVLVVAFASLIAWLAIFGPDGETPIASPAVASDASAPDVAATQPSDATPTDGAAGSDSSDVTESTSDPEAGADAGQSTPGTSDEVAPGVEGAVVDPVGEADALTDPTVASEVRTDLDLPPAGIVRVGGDEFELVRSCVGLRPFAPADDGDVVSAHTFVPDDTGVAQVLERWSTGDGNGGVRVDGPGSAGVRQVSVADGPDGAFVTTLERPDGQVVDVALTPLPESERSCVDAVVTNEPGRFAFPHTRAVMAVCATGDPSVDGRVVAVLTEGSRIGAVGNGDGTVTVSLVAPESLTSEPLDLVDPSAELFADGTQLGFSGLVSDGAVSRDLTFDVDTVGARLCTDADTGRLG